MFYGNVDDFKSYCTSRNKDLSETWSDELIESALLISSEWLDGKYENIFIGYKADGYKQERSWPREAAVVQFYPYYLFAKDEIPEQIKKATYEAAFRNLISPGSLETDFTPNQYKSVRVEGAISVEYNSSLTYASDIQTEIPIIQTLMSDLIDYDKSGSFSRVSGRASRV